MTGHRWVVGGMGRYGPYGLQAGLSWQTCDPEPSRYGDSCARLGLTNYYNWKYNRMQDARFVPMSFLATLDFYQKSQGPRSMALADKGRFWLIGNEPEDPNQGFSTPAQARQMAYRWRQEVGPHFAIGGVNWWKNRGINNGRDWLNAYVNHCDTNGHGTAPQYWHVHFHFAADYRELAARVQEFEQWIMRQPSQFRKAYMISEVALHPAASVVEQKRAILWLAKKLASQPNVDQAGLCRGAYWYSAHSPFSEWQRTNMLNAAATSATDIGAYLKYVKGLPDPANEPYPNA